MDTTVFRSGKLEVLEINMTTLIRVFWVVWDTALCDLVSQCFRDILHLCKLLH
jgi:hypothetical protein